MMTFTINETNEIVAFSSQEEASAATQTPFDSFATEQELAELAATWPADRLVAIWNGLPGVEAVKKFKNAKTAISRIWQRIQGLGDAAKPEAEPSKAKATRKPKAGAQSAKGPPAKGKATKKTTPAKTAPKGKKGAKGSKPAAEPKAARTGTKSEEVIAMLKRKGGATLAEIMEHTGWQKHTTRGWVSGFLGKKMGIEVESFRSDKGERTYRINQ